MSESSTRDPRHLLQQHKLAKDLIRAARAGDEAALSRLRAVFPDRERFKLADAHLVVARDAGFASWPKLIKHVEQQELAAAGAALMTGDAEKLRRLLAGSEFLRSQINAPHFAFGRQAIHCAAKNVALIDVLLEFGADPNLKSDWDKGPYVPLDDATEQSARHLLARGATLTPNAAARLGWIDELRAMLDQDPALVHHRGGDGKQPLHEAGTVEIAELLMDRGAQLDAECIDHKSTPAQYALAERPDVCRAILSRGARPDAFIAARLDDVQMAEQILKQDPTAVTARVNLPGYAPAPPFNIYCWTLGWYLSPRLVAQEAGHRDVAEFFAQHSDARTLFLDAIWTGDADTARSLGSRNFASVAPHRTQDHQMFSHVTHFGRPAVFKLMLELGFDPTAPGHDGGSALHHCCWVGAHELLAMVLKSGRFDLEVRDPNHQSTPLGWAVYGSANCGYAQGDYLQTVTQLLDAGARIENLAKPPAELVIDELSAREDVKQLLKRRLEG